jgi:hypothetical protein
MGRPHKRVGTKLKKAEIAFCALPHQHRKREVWHKMCDLCGVPQERAEEHLRLALAITEGG